MCDGKGWESSVVYVDKKTLSERTTGIVGQRYNYREAWQAGDRK